MTEPKITRRKVTDLLPDPSNANRGTERGHRALDDSVNEVGLGRSVLTDKNGVLIAGNKTHQAAVENGFEDVIEVETDGNTLVVVKRTDLDLNDPDPNNKARKAAYYDNRVGQLSLDWSPEQLLADLNAGVNLDALFSKDELADLLAGMVEDEPAEDAGAQVDRAAELQALWQVQRGDVWQIGKHRLMCGDSTSAEDVARLMDGVKADAVVTDPPYGMNLDTDYSGMPETRIQSKTYERVIGDNADFNAAPLIAMFDYVREQFWWGGDYYYQTLPPHGSWIVWDKRNENSDGLVGNHFELCWSKSLHRRRIIRHHWSGVNARNQDMSRIHPTEKSVAVIIEIINDYVAPEGVVVDLFLGSGTTMVAAQNTSRICFGMEIDPSYCAVILERMKGLGLSPVLIKEPTGEDIHLDMTGAAEGDEVA